MLRSCRAGTLSHIGMEMISHELDSNIESSCSMHGKALAVCLGATLMGFLAIWA